MQRARRDYGSLNKFVFCLWFCLLCYMHAAIFGQRMKAYSMRAVHFTIAVNAILIRSTPHTYTRDTLSTTWHIYANTTNTHTRNSQLYILECTSAVAAQRVQKGHARPWCAFRIRVAELGAQFRMAKEQTFSPPWAQCRVFCFVIFMPRKANKSSSKQQIVLLLLQRRHDQMYDQRWWEQKACDNGVNWGWCIQSTVYLRSRVISCPG